MGERVVGEEIHGIIADVAAGVGGEIRVGGNRREISKRE